MLHHSFANGKLQKPDIIIDYQRKQSGNMPVVQDQIKPIRLAGQVNQLRVLPGTKIIVKRNYIKGG